MRKAGTINQFAISIHNRCIFFAKDGFINLGQGCAILKYNDHTFLLSVTSTAHHASLPLITRAVVNPAAVAFLLGWKQSPHPATEILRSRWLGCANYLWQTVQR